MPIASEVPLTPPEQLREAARLLDQAQGSLNGLEHLKEALGLIREVEQAVAAYVSGDVVQKMDVGIGSFQGPMRKVRRR